MLDSKSYDMPSAAAFIASVAETIQETAIFGRCSSIWRKFLEWAGSSTESWHPQSPTGPIRSRQYSIRKHTLTRSHMTHPRYKL